MRAAALGALLLRRACSSAGPGPDQTVPQLVAELAEAVGGAARWEEMLARKPSLVATEYDLALVRYRVAALLDVYPQCLTAEGGGVPAAALAEVLSNEPRPYDRLAEFKPGEGVAGEVVNPQTLYMIMATREKAEGVGPNPDEPVGGTTMGDMEGWEEEFMADMTEKDWEEWDEEARREMMDVGERAADKRARARTRRTVPAGTTVGDMGENWMEELIEGMDEDDWKEFERDLRREEEEERKMMKEKEEKKKR
mmetsp:Transcript_23516/g.80126  ORF Transcript_23516/g.80126 Transcript_23516/m.80126 type:complete len:253 (+) Transcript_23516:1-759(+)